MYMGETGKALADAEECIKISPEWTKVRPFGTCSLTCAHSQFYFVALSLNSVLTNTVSLMYVPATFAHIFV